MGAMAQSEQPRALLAFLSALNPRASLFSLKFDCILQDPISR